MFLRALACVTVLTLGGCATNSGVVPFANGDFYVSKQAATGLGGMGDLRAEALQEASQHCATRSQTFLIVNEQQSKPPYIFGNYPRIDMTFRCVPESPAPSGS